MEFFYSFAKGNLQDSYASNDQPNYSEKEYLSNSNVASQKQIPIQANSNNPLSLSQPGSGNPTARAIQKPPRSSSNTSNKIRASAPIQQHTNRYDPNQNSEYQPDTLINDHRASSNSTNPYQNYVNSQTAAEYYEQLNQSQQQQVNYDTYSPLNSNFKETVKYEAPSNYSTIPATQRINYSEILNNSTSQNEVEYMRARAADTIKSDPNTQRLLQTPITNNQQRGQESFTPVTNTHETQPTPVIPDNYSRTMMSDSYSKTPVVPDNYSKIPDILVTSMGHQNPVKKKISPSPISHKQTVTDESKLSSNVIKQRIDQLKIAKDKANAEPNQNNLSKNSSPRKNDVINSVRISEPERKPLANEVKKEEQITITPVNDETKDKLINWLYSITLIKENVKDIDKKLPKICRDGVIFIDLINRLEGKHETIKGANRKPDTRTQVIANYLKLMSYLKRFEKMNSRYIFAQDYLMEGNENVFWGLLDDIWHLYNKKISPYDARYGRDEKRSSTARLRNSISESLRDGEKSRRTQFEVNYNDICYYDKSKMSASYVHHSPSRSKSPSERETFDTKTLGDQRYQQYSSRGKKQDIGTGFQSENSIEIHDEYRSHKQEPEQKSHLEDGYYNLYSKRNGQFRGSSHRPTKSIIKKGDTSKFFSQSLYESEPAEESSGNAVTNGISLEGENQVFEWLKVMGFKALLMRESTTLFEDPFRNGTLIAYVIGRVENERMHSLYKDPRSIDECRHNVYQAFLTLARRQTPIPSYLKGKEEAILKGDRNIILALLYSLMKIHETRAELNTSVATGGEKLYKQEASMYVPPYDDNERDLLEKSLIIWINSLGLFSDASTKPASFRELIILMKNGVLLSDLTAVIANQRLTTIHRRPTNELQCITNIRRALEFLREKKNMAQRYLWKEREIYKGNKFILLGLLEDLHRFFDGLPPRSNPNYFLEGPYIPNAEEIMNGVNDHKNISRKDSLETRIGIQSHSNMSVSPDRSQYNKSTYHVRGTSKEFGHRPEETNRSRVHDHTSRLNLSADEPISIIDYERKNMKTSYYSPSKQMNENCLSYDGSRWENLNENSSIYRSPRSEIRKFVQLDKPNHTASQYVRF